MKLHKILYLLPALTLVACNSDDDLNDTLSGNGKTPLSVTALLDANGKTSQTRAADKKFSADGDELKVMLRHVTWTGKVQSETDYVEADDAPQTEVSGSALISRLVTFTAKGGDAFDRTIEDILPFEQENISLYPTSTNQASSLTTATPLYWDDFSVGGKGDDTDIRTDGHYLQSYYGYCYNGGAPDVALSETTGELGWKVLADQSGADGPTNFKKSDLLWSPAQMPVSYAHQTSQTENHGQILIPFLHAMSKVTINVIAGDGFASDYDFASTELKLDKVRITCTAKAPSAELTYPTDGSGKDDVKMMPGTIGSTDSKPSRQFSAIIVPSVLSVGNTFATITNMDGNAYSIPVTENMIKKAGSDGLGWGNELIDADEDVNSGTAQARPQTRGDDQTIPGGNGHQMKSGVHYVLNVTLHKAKVSFSATILDWDEVEAEGVGEIQFVNDVKDKDGSIATALQENDIYVYKSTTTTFGTAATTLHWNKTSQVWKYNPVIYWEGEPEYFRALTNVRKDASSTSDNESLMMENGRDALWGTTLAANGYEEGEALNPRTGQVPLTFYHAMSKITFNLVDANAGDEDAAATITLTDATIQLTNLATGGVLNLNTGLMQSLSDVSDKVFSEDISSVPARMGYYAAKENISDTHYDADLTLKDYIVTPQEIGPDAMVVITLADGTVYKAQLNKCYIENVATGSTSLIDTWKRGVHYTYTITLGKETITFRALIEKWDDVEGGGKATLEWD